jgi:hypothetical protein
MSLLSFAILSQQAHGVEVVAVDLSLVVAAGLAVWAQVVVARARIKASILIFIDISE